MATTAAKADIGSQMLKFFQMFAAAIKEGIDSGAYGNRVGEMQAAYDQIMAEMPMLPLLPAIAAAIHDATGVWLNQQPFTPDKVVKAFRQQGIGVI